MVIEGRLFHRLVFAQVVDVASYAFFMVAIGVSIHAERNPIILALSAVGGIYAVLFAKIGVPVLVTIRNRNKVLKPRLHNFVVIIMATATASGIVGAGFNIASIINTMTGVTIHG